MIAIYVDTASLDEIRTAVKNPLVKGVTTNPTLMAKAGVTDYERFARDALQIVGSLPISFEVFSDEWGEMERQARKIASWGGNVNVKIPVTNTRGESAAPLVRELSADGILCNVTAVFNERQFYEILEKVNQNAPVIISIFAGRMADCGVDPNILLPNAFIHRSHKARFLWASSREVFNIYQAEKCGYNIITISSDILAKYEKFKGKDLAEFSLETVKMFYDDAKKSGYKL